MNEFFATFALIMFSVLCLVRVALLGWPPVTKREAKVWTMFSWEIFAAGLVTLILSIL